MRKRKGATALFVALVATLAFGVPFASAAAEPGQVVKVSANTWIAKKGTQGKVRASNANCVENREVLIKANGFGTIERTFTDANGSWKVNKERLYSKFSVPTKLYAVAPQVYQGTAGPIYQCLRSTSRKVKIPISAAQPGQVARVKGNLWIANVASQGKIRAANGNCVGGRTVLVKADGYGTVARTTTNANGFWEVDRTALYTSVEIPAKFYAVAPQVTQGTAGPIYQCEKTISRTVTIP